MSRPKITDTKSKFTKSSVALSSTTQKTPTSPVLRDMKQQPVVSDLTEALVTTILSDYEANRTMIDDIPKIIPLQISPQTSMQYKFVKHSTMRRLCNYESDLDNNDAVEKKKREITDFENENDANQAEMVEPIFSTPRQRALIRQKVITQNQLISRAQAEASGAQDGMMSPTSSTDYSSSSSEVVGRDLSSPASSEYAGDPLAFTADDKSPAPAQEKDDTKEETLRKLAQNYSGPQFSALTEQTPFTELFSDPTRNRRNAQFSPFSSKTVPQLENTGQPTHRRQREGTDKPRGPPPVCSICDERHKHKRNQNSDPLAGLPSIDEEEEDESDDGDDLNMQEGEGHVAGNEDEENENKAKMVRTGNFNLIQRKTPKLFSRFDGSVIEKRTHSQKTKVTLCPKKEVNKIVPPSPYTVTMEPPESESVNGQDLNLYKSDIRTEIEDILLGDYENVPPGQSSSSSSHGSGGGGVSSRSFNSSGGGDGDYDGDDDGYGGSTGGSGSGSGSGTNRQSRNTPSITKRRSSRGTKFVETGKEERDRERDRNMGTLRSSTGSNHSPQRTSPPSSSGRGGGGGNSNVTEVLVCTKNSRLNGSSREGQRDQSGGGGGGSGDNRSGAEAEGGGNTSGSRGSGSGGRGGGGGGGGQSDGSSGSSQKRVLTREQAQILHQRLGNMAEARGSTAPTSAGMSASRTTRTALSQGEFAGSENTERHHKPALLVTRMIEPSNPRAREPDEFVYPTDVEDASLSKYAHLGIYAPAYSVTQFQTVMVNTRREYDAVDAKLNNAQNKKIANILRRFSDKETTDLKYNRKIPQSGVLVMEVRKPALKDAAGKEGGEPGVPLEGGAGAESG